MEQLKIRLSEDDVRGVVRSAEGEEIEFRRKGVIDLYTLVKTNASFLQGATVADRVIGRGAALLMIKGGVRQVFAYVMSMPAYEALTSAGIETTYATLQPNIINRKGDDICPVEKLTMNTDSPDEAFDLIGQFVQTTH